MNRPGSFVQALQMSSHANPSAHVNQHPRKSSKALVADVVCAEDMINAIAARLEKCITYSRRLMVKLLLISEKL